MIYVTSDIHGFYDEFLQMLKIIDFKDEDFLYIIGDVIDRGPKSMEMLEYVMEQANIELLMGNHEHSMLCNIYQNDSPWSDQIVRDFWNHHGGSQTKKQFMKLSALRQKRIITYLRSLPSYKRLGQYILVHASLRLGGWQEGGAESVDELLARQSKLDLFWEKDDFLSNPFVMPGYTVIFGHTSTLMIRQMQGRPMDSVEILKDGDRLAIDCGYPFGGRLVMVRLDDMQAFYLSPSGVITVRDHAGRL